jgi:histidyl-tRNA synthetase
MKPSLPQGTRDFGPDVVYKREFIFTTIKHVFELYGFQPLETPAMENLDTLMGKYGDEGDKLIFKILNNGLDHPSKRKQAEVDFEKLLQGKNIKSLTERALKYDLTIPFARYVAMNHGQLTFPFKRYQIQPVWRADRPQKGRYREFFQCDADVVGSKSLINEVEFVSIYSEVFHRLGINNYELRINSRNILAALAELCGGIDKMLDITIAIDKLDKIGIDKVKTELSEKGLTKDEINIVEKYININGNSEEKLKKVKELFADSPTAKKGIEEIEFVFSMGSMQLDSNQQTENRKEKDDPSKNPNSSLLIDFTLARGLNYYTGIILEAKAPAEIKIGSIGGGGRYDDLTGLFGVPHIPGVGISFGVDRIFDVMEEMDLFPKTNASGTKILFLNTNENTTVKAYEMLGALRRKGIASEIYPDPVKPEKQFKYAENKNIPFVVREIKKNLCVLKNIKSGEQKTLPIDDLVREINNPSI